MEAESYLTDGFGLRAAIEARPTGWLELSRAAAVWQPPRLKGIQVAPEHGTPFLTASQVFDVRPAPRKWLAATRTPSYERRFAAPGLILVTCSGNVGKVAAASKAHAGKLISHDLLRVEPQNAAWQGWIFAYLRAPHTRRMMVAQRYGHIVKHLEPEHLERLPLLLLRRELLRSFNERYARLISLRNAAGDLTAEAEDEYASFFTLPDATASIGFAVSSARFATERRRLEAAPHSPSVDALRRALSAGARSVDLLADLAVRVFVPGRFKHVYGQNGVPYVDSADVLEVCPEPEKFVLSLSAASLPAYEVDAGWLLIPCSGQTYGNLGHVVIATSWHQNKVLSNHILRVVPRDDRVHRGYLQCALGHLVLGRPLLVSLAFGSSVPELDPDDIAEVPVARLGKKNERAIGERIARAAELRGEADILEGEMVAEADGLVAEFLAGDPEHRFQNASKPS